MKENLLKFYSYEGHLNTYRNCYQFKKYLYISQEYEHTSQLLIF